MSRFLLTVATIAIAANLSIAGSKPEIRTSAQLYEIEVSFDTTAHTLSGTTRIYLPPKGAKSAGFLLNPSFEIESVTLNGEAAQPQKRDYTPQMVSGSYGTYGEWDPSGAALWSVPVTKTAAKAAAKAKALIIEVHYNGMLYAPLQDRTFNRDEIAMEVSGSIGTEGIYLGSSAWWYPRIPDEICTHTVTARLPKGWNCVTDGVPVSEGGNPQAAIIEYQSDEPTGGLSFSSGPFVVATREHNDVTLATYFLPAQAELSDGYLDACERYLDMYGKLIAPYPFKRFAVVDNFLPSGYGMPGWTLLGSEVLRLPFIKDVSLGHEILHNWFGNSLLVDYTQGNWCEGLTVYLADYKYKEDADSAAAAEYRRDQLRDFTAYVNESNAYPISQFSERSNPADRAIGYGKVMMIFHMLRLMLDQVDPGIFPQVVGEVYRQYQWQPIGWEIWRKEFERRLKQQLGWFFDQWLNDPGAPRIEMKDPNFRPEDSGWTFQFTVVTQTARGRPSNYFLPVRAVTDVGWFNYQSFIQANEQGVGISGPGQLLAVVVDPGYDVFRTVYRGEMPVTFADFFGDDDAVFVLPKQGTRAMDYRKAAEGLKNEKQTIITDADFNPQWRAHSLWIMGGPDENSVWSALPPEPTSLGYLPYVASRWKEEEPQELGMTFQRQEFRGGSLCASIIAPHPDGGEAVVVWTLPLPDANPVSGTRKLSHYGKYSYLRFDGDTNVDKGVWSVSGSHPLAWRSADQD